MKHCHKCNTSKPLSDWNKSKATKDGLQTKCKECEKQLNKQYYQDNKEAIDEYTKQYYQDNKESLAQYRLNNRESINEKNLKLHMREGYGVYTLTHLPTQCYYVGEGQIYDRRNNHFNKLQRGVNPHGFIQEHYNKHPNIDDWEFKVIKKWDEVNKDIGKKVENKLIKWGFENVPNKILNKHL